MCQCIKTVGDSILEITLPVLKEKFRDVKVQESDFQTIALTIRESGSGWKFFAPYEIKYTYNKTNGEPAARPRKKVVSMFFNFCPFCGEKITTGE